MIPHLSQRVMHVLVFVLVHVLGVTRRKAV
jgi:hypothetical protein